MDRETVCGNDSGKYEEYDGEAETERAGPKHHEIVRVLFEVKKDTGKSRMELVAIALLTGTENSALSEEEGSEYSEGDDGEAPELLLGDNLVCKEAGDQCEANRAGADTKIEEKADCAGPDPRTGPLEG